MARSARKIVRVPVSMAERNRIVAALAEGKDPKTIAAAEGCAVSRIYFVRGRYGTARHVVEPDEVVVDPGPAPGVPYDLTVTGGRHADLRAYGDAHGLSYTQALSDWHRAQRGLPPMARGK